MLSSLLPFLRTYAKTKWGPTFSSRKSLEVWQEKRVQNHLRFLKENSPYYGEWLEKHSPEHWRRWPLMDKKEMMAHFDELNTASLRREDLFEVAFSSEQSRDFSPTLNGYTVGLSSGTSGNRGLFLVSPSEQAQWAGYILARMLPGPLWRKQRVALFLRAGGPLYQSTQSSRIQFRHFDTFRPVKENLLALERYRPTVLVAPPSMLRILSHQTIPELEKVISVAEVLDPLDRAFIEKAFGLPVHQIYQATEGCLASTCSHGTLHLHEDLVVIEKDYLDPEQRRFSPIITDFTRRSQPIIRYRLDDILTESQGPCPCGSIFAPIELIEGRCDDTLILPALGGTGTVNIFPDFVRRRIIACSAQIEEYRVTQVGPESLELQLLGPKGIELAVLQGLRQLFGSLGAKSPSISCVPFQASTAQEKLRRIQRRLPIHD